MSVELILGMSLFLEWPPSEPRGLFNPYRCDCVFGCRRTRLAIAAEQWCNASLMACSWRCRFLLFRQI